MSVFVRIIQVFALLSVALSGAMADPAPASRWASDLYSSVRLVDLGGQTDRLVAIEIMLKPGFKTYWRYPGDSGVPPVFNWAGSDNLAGVEILWPAPVRFSDISGQSIGYHQTVSFLGKITPLDPAKPVLARLSLDYAVCEKLCLPAHGLLDISLPASERRPQAQALLKAVPTPDLKGFDLAISASGNADKAFVIVDVTAPQGFQGETDLFAEGPTDDWALPLPTKMGQNSNAIRYKILIDGVPVGRPWRGAMLTLTLVTPSGALEKRLTLPQ